jgi:hypothetical protein
MNRELSSRPEGNGGFAPATPGFNAVAPEWIARFGAAHAAPSVPAAESTLGSHPCVALSSAQVLPEWTTSTPPCNDFSANGDYPLNFVSRENGPLQQPIFGFYSPSFSPRFLDFRQDTAISWGDNDGDNHGDTP